LANVLFRAAVAAAKVTAVIGACTVAPDNIGSFKVTAPTPAPLPTVPYVVATRYASSNCQGVSFDRALATNFIIDACTPLGVSSSSSALYGLVSVTGTVRRADVSPYTLAF
jgi:hypothetical protein